MDKKRENVEVDRGLEFAIFTHAENCGMCAEC